MPEECNLNALLLRNGAVYRDRYQLILLQRAQDAPRRAFHRYQPDTSLLALSHHKIGHRGILEFFRNNRNGKVTSTVGCPHVIVAKVSRRDDNAPSRF